VLCHKAAVDFPTQTPRRDDRAPQPATRVRTLDGDDALALRKTLQTAGLDTGDALLAAFYALVARYTGGEPPQVLARHATRSPGRALAPLSLTWDGAELFRSLVTRVGSATMERTLERTVEETVAPERVPFSVSFEESVDAPATVLPATELPAGRELALVAREDGHGLTLTVTWDQHLFAPHFIDRLLDHLLVLLRSGAGDPEQRADRLPLLDDDERRRVLTEWNDSAEPYPRDRRVHQLFEEQAREHPTRTAAVFPAGHGVAEHAAVVELTYGDLDDRANRVADVLYRKGALSDELVGIYTSRSPAMLAALFGVLKAGAAYLPLDPAFPRDRLAMMVEDAEVRFVLTERALKDRVPGDVEVLVIEDLLGVVVGEGRAASSPSPAPPLTDDDTEQLAYAIYTSGSTGRPKGVLIPHRAVVNFLDTMARRPGLLASDRLLAVTTLSFDISVLEIFGPLTQGACVVVASQEDVVRPDRLATLLTAHDISVMQATPATWRMLVESGWPGESTLRVLCGGEALPDDLADALLGRCAELWNMYGPTETTVWSAVERVLAGQPITIGGPIGNTTLYVLDAHKQPVPVGVVGELYIGGDGVARGYRGRPELTAERFCPDPFDPRGAARMYRTGDMARFRDDGRVDFLGRADLQVKIRGFRIELGEIEAALTRLPGVAQAIVVAREMAGLLRLVAYLRTDAAPADTAALDDGVLRAQLKERLPNYMVPSAFVWLERFPVTPNNKVDRKALPDPTTFSTTTTAPSGRAPATDTEDRLLALWREVLGLSSVQVEDRFFDLGGDSLLAVRLFTRIEEVFGVRLGADALLEAPDVARIARLIDDGVDTSRVSITIQAGDDRPPIYCISGIAGHSLVFRALAERTDRDRRFLGLRWPGLDGSGETHDNIAEIARFFVSEIEKLNPDEPIYLAGYSFGGLVAYEMAVEFQLRGREVAMLTLFDVLGPKLGVVGEKLSRLSTHLNNLQKRSVGDRSRYVARWFRVGLPRLVRPAESYSEFIGDRGEQTDAVRRMVVAHDHAQTHYRPRHYTGHGLLMRAVNLPFNIEARHAPLYGWEGLFGEGLEIVEMKAPHMEMLDEPWVAHVAEPFSRALSRADHESQLRAEKRDTASRRAT